MSFSLRRASASLVCLLCGTGSAWAQQSAPSQPAPAQPAPQQPAPGQGQPPVVPPIKAQPIKPLVKLPANVVARVGGQDITREQALAMFNTVAGRPIVDQLAQALAVEQEAKRLGVVVTDAEIKARLKQTQEAIVRQAYQMGTPMTFQEIAQREGFTPELLNWSTRQDLLRQKTFAKSLETSTRIQSRDDERNLAHILFATVPLPGPDGQVTPDADPAKREAAAKAKVDQVFADLKAGKIKWEDAAKQSEDKSNADKGGELGFYKQAVLDPSFARVGWAIEKPGDLAGPVKSQFGWHIIKLVQKGSDLPAAEKTAFRRGQIERIVSDPNEMRQWLLGLQASRNVIMNRQVQIVPGAKLSLPKPAVTPAAPAKRPAARRAASLR